MVTISVSSTAGTDGSRWERWLDSKVKQCSGNGTSLLCQEVTGCGTGTVVTFLSPRSSESVFAILTVRK